MIPEVSYIPYATSSHEQTGDIIIFTQFEEGCLVENEHNVSEYDSLLDSIDESSTFYNSDDRSISKNALEYIRYGNYIHPDINAIYVILKIGERIRQGQS